MFTANRRDSFARLVTHPGLEGSIHFSFLPILFPRCRSSHENACSTAKPKKNVLFYIYGTHSIPREATPAGTTSLGGWSGRKQKNCSGNIYRLLFFFRETELLFGSADRMSSRFGGPNGCSVIADRTSIRHRVLNLFRVLVGLTSVRLFGRLDACVFLFIRSNFDSADRTILLLLGGADE